jgi:hypothetical protein
MRLSDSGQDRVKSEYTKTAYRLFPRYRLDEAIGVEVERLTGQEFRSLEEARELVLVAGGRAQSSLIREFQRSTDACAAINTELKAFERYVAGLEAPQLSCIEPLPYRRVLRVSEREQLSQKLRTRWGVAGYWYPLSKCDRHTNVVAFHRELWEHRDGTSLLFQATRERDIEHCLLLLEGPHDYEIDRSLMDPIYGGSESFLTSDFGWLVYSSHESSIAVAGWLADFFRAQWPDWRSVTYGGPFHTTDMRGSWGTLMP